MASGIVPGAFGFFFRLEMKVKRVESGVLRVKF